MKPRITARCIRCKKKSVLTEKQIEAAKELGAPMSECCQFIMEVIKVEI